jgi:hypothetical protein
MKKGEKDVDYKQGTVVLPVVPAPGRLRQDNCLSPEIQG